MWNNKAKPTRSNVQKRLSASAEALDSAVVLLAQMPADKRVLTAVNNALAWIRDADAKLDANKGRRK
jgi:hypothetical protein